MELIAIFFLISLNGFLAMSEIAFAATKASRLETLKSKKALNLLRFLKNPVQFLSTIQVGITFIGILTGMFSAATIIGHLDLLISKINFLSAYSSTIAYTITLFIITFMMILFGELIPKRIALSNPEKIAIFVFTPIRVFGVITMPLVWLLSRSTDFFSRIFISKKTKSSKATEEEVKNLILMGMQEGSVPELEMDLLNKVFKLDDLKVERFMTPKKDFIWIYLDEDIEVQKQKIFNHPHKSYPVATSSGQKCLGVLYTHKFLNAFQKNENVNVNDLLEKPLIVDEELNMAGLLLQFQEENTHFALVINEQVEITGLITMNEISEALIGNYSVLHQEKHENFIERIDGSFFVEASTPIKQFTSKFSLKNVKTENTNFHTLGGFLIQEMKGLPEVSERIEIEHLIIEIADLDGHRIDKVIVYVNDK
ncbi:MAG: HlyC/CorC family transporter [Chitinophagaceae bacterium]|nr:MAG: HlyC/CorC family transporter [Chitinophagaceae bacterium]